MSEVKISWGLSADGVMRHISEVANGKACGCICPSPNCSSPLIANQGSLKAHYFSHQTNTDCGGESALHLAAKQILEDAASKDEYIILPEIRAEYSCADMLGEIVAESCVELASFELLEARQEVRLSDSLITDVFAKSSRGKELAIEIFVTNAKDTISIGKYKSIGVDALEIDLSRLPWTISRHELKEAVLHKAKRTWLHNNRICELYQSLKQQVDQTVESNNRDYLSNLNGLAASLSTNTNLPVFCWPELITYRALSKNERFAVTRVPKITHFNEAWAKSDFGYSGTAVVENKTIVNVLLYVDVKSSPITEPDIPTLLIGYNQHEYDEKHRFNLKWENVQSWKSKLEKIADSELKQRRLQQINKSQRISSFAEYFRSSDEPIKMQILCQKLGLAAPTQTSNHVSCWNASYDVWKTLVWVYKIHGNEGYKIDAGDIASDPWFESLLGFSTEDWAYESRRKLLGAWLKKLYEVGFLRRVAWSKYEVEHCQLSNFVPWQFIR
ncbi:competence protein CoiA family protein [Shewanella mangrovisoli]|uniref:competence protein CoiA family protein n=1 Tax=Shewanella mangrovisoli TaxID=2864211 RepID=UPI001C65EF57|nr:competence protein CoiA family protein [Shewanella mangrovisoli]QYK09223.1 hypothetical protein K0H60_00500 [Shewanella mangrovisoli]